MGGARRRLMAEALLWLAIARVVLLLVPFRAVAARLGDPLNPADGCVRAAELRYDAEALSLAREIGWAVRRTATYVPFRAVCLQQAVAAKLMLRNRGIASTLHLGVATPEGADKVRRAHAWLDAGQVKVTGYPVGPEFTEVACFL